MNDKKISYEVNALIVDLPDSKKLAHLDFKVINHLKLKRQNVAP